jgi:hypothetical protein
MLNEGSSKNKSQLYVQIATFMRTMVVLKEGIIKLEELDFQCRSSAIVPGKGRKKRAAASKRKRRRSQATESESDTSSDSGSDTDDANESSFKRSMSEIFGNNGKSIRLVKAGEFAWPSLKTVRCYAKRYKWGTRKAWWFRSSPSLLPRCAAVVVASSVTPAGQCDVRGELVDECW